MAPQLIGGQRACLMWTEARHNPITRATAVCGTGGCATRLAARGLDGAGDGNDPALSAWEASAAVARRRPRLFAAGGKATISPDGTEPLGLAYPYRIILVSARNVAAHQDPRTAFS